MAASPLSPQELYKTCDLETLAFNTTAELEDPKTPLGQKRALEAIEFGVNIKADGYNLFCLGPEGTGKTSLVKEYLEKAAKELSIPNDWCYVHNFTEKHKPVAISLPPGRGIPFKKDMEKLISEIKVSIPAAFEGEEYTNRSQIINEKYKSQKEEYFDLLQQKAKGKDVALLRMPVGLALAPMKDGEVLTPEAFDELEEKDRIRLSNELEELENELEDAVHDIPKWEKSQREEIEVLKQNVTNFAVKHLISSVKKKYNDIKNVKLYLNRIHKDIVENVDNFIEEEETGSDISSIMKQQFSGGEDPLRKYMVNVIINNADNEGAPVIFLDHPTVPNLIGRIEKQQQFGALIADFKLIKAGSLHKANGGFLVLDARQMLSHPYAWECLKRALRSKKVHIEAPGHDELAISTVTLEPEPIPLDVKIVLLGEGDIYHVMNSNDPDFEDLFKVLADFDMTINRGKENIVEYCKMIAMFARKKNLRSFNKHAVAKIIEYASREADDATKLTAHMASIADIMSEADYCAKTHKSNAIGKNHVQQAIDAKIQRYSKIRELMLEEIHSKSIMIDVTGEKIGQINGLVVYQLGRQSFGRPSRITCLVRMGKGEVVDIEREVDLGGPIHSKGMLILSSFLASRYANNTPLALTASIVFEQSYGGVDGDSASSTELYALLSAISGIPIKQSFAVTGSVNQFGEIQPIGGVNEKIEGYFDVCKEQRLTGDQGVLIPHSNVKHLMLNQEILDAVEHGQFSIYPVKTIDEGIEILTGMPAGERDETGVFTAGSINRKVESKLKKLYKQSLAAQNGEDKT
ncbi:MAG: AAA family ATPase [Alphaproteobacteria bacterium]|nr:AAA family ATPase [Alphaproteobacteria bacterium]